MHIYMYMYMHMYIYPRLPGNAYVFQVTYEEEEKKQTYIACFFVWKPRFLLWV